MHLKYRQTYEKKLQLEIIGESFEEIQDWQKYFQKQNIPITVQSLNDSEGTWEMNVKEK